MGDHVQVGDDVGVWVEWVGACVVGTMGACVVGTMYEGNNVVGVAVG